MKRKWMWVGIAVLMIVMAFIGGGFVQKDNVEASTLALASDEFTIGLPDIPQLSCGWQVVYNDEQVVLLKQWREYDGLGHSKTFFTFVKKTNRRTILDFRCKTDTGWGYIKRKVITVY